MHSSDGEEEMAESDMDEYSFEEDGESYYENAGAEEGEESAPALVPITIQKKAPKPDRDYESDSSEPEESSVQQSNLSSSELDSTKELMKWKMCTDSFTLITLTRTKRIKRKELTKNLKNELKTKKKDVLCIRSGSVRQKVLAQQIRSRLATNHLACFYQNVFSKSIGKNQMLEEN